MPYVLSKIITKKEKGLWGEGTPYESSVIYDIHNSAPTAPPVHYEAHLLKPHSLPHMDAPAHILKNGQTVDWYFKEKDFEGFYGKVLVIRLDQKKFLPGEPISEAELQAHIKAITSNAPKRIILTFDNNDTDKVLVLTEAAANSLIKNNPGFCMYGTAWKSTDHQPGSKERPIHKIFFAQNALLFECLNLEGVPAGEYYWFSFPIPLEGASEAPVCPVLFTKKELDAL